MTVRYDGPGTKVGTRRKTRDEWLALKPGTHEGYVEWDRAEAIRMMPLVRPVTSDRPADSRCPRLVVGDSNPFQLSADSRYPLRSATSTVRAVLRDQLSHGGVPS